SEQTTTSLTSTLFSMTAVVRTNDSKLVITPEATASLGTIWDYPVTKTNSTNQASVPSGFERKVFSLNPSNNSKVFLRLQSVYTP
ncbi:MAG: hypothetical protein JHC52_11565, partial [Chthoniobacterales bacterium]|nr:hypothetical protein [Chthoniobacterales bacterium]